MDINEENPMEENFVEEAIAEETAAQNEQTGPEQDFPEFETITEPEIPAYTPPRARNPWDDFDGGAAYAPKRQRTRRKSGKGKAVLAAVLAVLLVLGGCLGTAAAVNSRWEKRVGALSDQFRGEISDLQKQVKDLQKSAAVGTGVSVSGTAATGDGMTPAQVYAQNVRSVVAIAANATTTNIYGQTSETASSGSGFFITSDGYVVTNHHVIDGAHKLTVITYDGTEYPAELVGSNATNDVALLKVEGENLPAVTIGSSNNLIVGDMVVAIGNPLGELTSTQTVGYVSAKDRTINIDGTQIYMIQTDAAINAGNSGGPLFNMYGEVVGITSAKYSGSSNSGASIEGIGFAIPIDDVIGMISDLRDYGYITGAYLGVMVRSMDSEAAAAYGLPMGVYVESVTEGSCAEKAGVQAKDIIVGLGEYSIDGYTALARALRQFKAGQESTVTVYRGGSRLTLPIIFDERPVEAAAAAPETTQPAETTPDMTLPEDFEIPEGMEDWFEYFFKFFGEEPNG